MPSRSQTLHGGQALQALAPRALAASATLALVALLTACAPGVASGASAQATATCPPSASAANFLAFSGAVTSASPTSVTVQPTSGASVTVALANTTRYSVTSSVPASSLAAGTPVLVLTDTNATVARSVRILPAGSAGATGGGFGGGFGGGARGTPRPGANPACARRGGFGAGAGGGGFGGAGTDGTGAGFQGLRGTVDSATATTLTFDDAQGQTYSVALTATTTITKTAAGQASDLKTGAHVIIAAQKVSGQTVARTITIQA